VGLPPLDSGYLNLRRSEFVARTKKRDHPPMNERAWRLRFAAVALTALAGCGPSSKPAAPPQASPAAPATAVEPMGLGRPAVYAPMGPAELDHRPDALKSADFADRLDEIWKNQVTTDADFLGRIRNAFQGTQADAKALVSEFRDRVAEDRLALPEAPRLSGCFARAAAPNAKAEASVAGVLSDRRERVEAIAAISDRPLSLADFGPLATDISSNKGIDETRTSIAAARTAIASCRAAPAATAPQRPRAPTPAPSEATRAQSPAPAPATVTLTPPSPPPKKPGYFGRLFGGS
jgi:hypothetical protein